MANHLGFQLPLINQGVTREDQSLNPDESQSLEKADFSKRLNPDLQGLIQQMVDTAVTKAVQQALPRLLAQQAQVDGKPTHAEEHKPRQEKIKPRRPEIDWESVSSAELKANKYRGKGVVDEKIRRSYLAIVSHNDNATSNDDRWVINNQALRQLSGCNGMLIADWIERHKLAIDDHNNKYGLGQYHNKRHKQLIAKVITW